METSNRIANVLVNDLGVIPGNRVLLRGPINPMLAACWFAVLKIGGVVVCTMPLLRERELRYLADKAEIKLALTDARDFRPLYGPGSAERFGLKHLDLPGLSEDVDTLEDLMRLAPHVGTNTRSALQVLA